MLQLVALICIVVKVCLYNLYVSDKAAVVGRSDRPDSGLKLKVLLFYNFISGAIFICLNPFIMFSTLDRII